MWGWHPGDLWSVLRNQSFFMKGVEVAEVPWTGGDGYSLVTLYPG